ncbi:hypothetical protein L9F63_004446 [Diploptera punctata]|uniref:Uncharacterized protein n=1 Tax=Diploptera punctata TaxID=6984 RepID=A0AAD8E7A1_DIPPU|nr:hypothetical protein L9F63_004446 [Diploptera punctata]
MKLSTKFLDGYISEYPLESKLGVRMIDLLDVLIEAEVFLEVTYHARDEICHIYGLYELMDISYLSLPPEVSEENPSPEHAVNILNYIVNLVRYNNLLLLRNDQHCREMKIGTGMDRFRGIRRNLRKYNSTRHCEERRIISSEDMIIKEIYRKHSEIKYAYKKGFSCKIDMTCSMEEAPIIILEGWKKLRSDIDRGII